MRFLCKDYEKPIAIAQAIKYILYNPEKIRTIKEKAISVGRSFSKELIDKKEIEIYETIISTKANDKSSFILWWKVVSKYIFQETKSTIKNFIKKSIVGKVYYAICKTQI